ncbi:hypothetical protein ACP0BX_003771 [Amphidinium carterae]
MVATAFRVVAAALLAFPSVSAFAGQARTNDTPLTKVIELLNGMIVKGTEAMKAEQVEYAKYSTWCTETKSDLDNNIKEATGELVQLEADSTKAAADAESLGQDISELDAELASLGAQEANASGVRSKEHASFLTTEADFSESIDAIKRAIQVLKAQSADVPQSLLEVSRSKLLPTKAKAALAAFLSVQSGAVEMAPPEANANAYEFQSSSVIDMLEKLVLKFFHNSVVFLQCVVCSGTVQDQLLALKKAEMNAKHNYEVLMQQLTDDSAHSKRLPFQPKLRPRQVVWRTMPRQRLIQRSLQPPRPRMKRPSLALPRIALCKLREYNKNQKLRVDELKALKEAVSVLSSEAVSGNAEKYLPPALLQQRARGATVLAQLRSSTGQEENQNREKAVELLQASAKKLGNKYLATIAAHVADDPFDKQVKQMIKDLIVKLQEEANSEADHNGYCTSELAKNKMTPRTRVQRLRSSAHNLMSSTQLALNSPRRSQCSPTRLQAQGQMAEATTLRQEEKATNNNTVIDAKEAQVAVEKAKQVLAEYYSAAAAALIQTNHKAPYKGMQTDSGNIMDFLEVVLSDFARLEAETSAAEDSAQAAYEKFMAETKQDIAVKDTEMRHKDINKNRADTAAQSTKEELELTQAELTAAMEYYDKLKPECVDTGLSYADRKLAREQEIQSLKEALLVLNGEDLP